MLIIWLLITVFSQTFNEIHFFIVEPGVASSDATNISCSIVRDGSSYVINGLKWWSSGAGDPRCKFAIVMGVTNPENDRLAHSFNIWLLVWATICVVTLFCFTLKVASSVHDYCTIEYTRCKACKTPFCLWVFR